MKDKIDALVYPFDVEFLTVIRHKNLLKDYNIKSLASLSGLGLNNRDIGTLDGGNKLNLFIDENFEDCLDKCDAVIFTNNYQNIDFYKFILPKMIKCIDCNKDVVCLIKLDNDMYNYLSNKAEMNNVNFRYFYNMTKFNISNQDLQLKNLLDIDVPIVLVLGDFENTQKFEIQLSLRENLIKKNYTVSQIGSKSYCEILGFHSFPDFMLESNISEEEKVLLFNRFVKQIESEENPDIIIIGIPGGAIPYSKQFYNGFGILHYEVSRAITPDFCIYSTLYVDDNFKYINNLVPLLKYRFGYDVDCINMSTFKFLSDESKIMREPHLLKLSTEFINKEKIKLQKSIPIPLLNILDEKDNYNITEFMINELSGYAEIEQI